MVDGLERIAADQRKAIGSHLTAQGACSFAGSCQYVLDLILAVHDRGVDQRPGGSTEPRAPRYKNDQAQLAALTLRVKCFSAHPGSMRDAFDRIQISRK